MPANKRCSGEGMDGCLFPPKNSPFLSLSEPHCLLVVIDASFCIHMILFTTVSFTGEQMCIPVYLPYWNVMCTMNSFITKMREFY